MRSFRQTQLSAPLPTATSCSIPSLPSSSATMLSRWRSASNSSRALRQRVVLRQQRG